MTVEIEWAVEERVDGLEDVLRAVSEACFASEGIENACMGVRIATGDDVRALNLRMRGIDRETDVLSFPTARFRPGTTARDNLKRLKREYDPHLNCIYLGDCVISLPRASAQAREYGHSLLRELGYLAAHSALHLMGYDHEDPDDRRKMREIEERVMLSVSLPRTEDHA